MTTTMVIEARACLAAVFAACGALMATADVLAQEAKPAATTTVRVSAAWVRATPDGARVGAGYMKIENTGKDGDRLLGGTLPQAGRVQIHEMSQDGGVMRMRELAKGLEIKPGAAVELTPGGLHIMFLDLKEGLRDGAPVKGTLQFEKAGTVAVEYRVEPLRKPAGDAPAGAAGGGHKH